MESKRIAAIAAGALLLAVGIAWAQEAPGTLPACPHCAGECVEYNRSRMLVAYGDGMTVASCSLHCAALDMRARKGKEIRSIRVADYETGDLIDAERATWVIQRNKPGVMTKQAKWAFRTNEEMEHFIKRNGGARATWKEVLALEAAE